MDSSENTLTVSQIAVGRQHTCALLSNGRVRCWGFNNKGQLGYGNTVDIGDDEHPHEAGYVDVGGDVVQIAAGQELTCALLTTGALRCWGLNDVGQLGRDNTVNIGDDETPAAAGDISLVPGATESIAQVSLGAEHACALIKILPVPLPCSLLGKR